MPTKPSYDDFHRMGASIVEAIPGVVSFREIGDELGICRQSAYHACCVAVGKLMYHAAKMREWENRRKPHEI